MTILPFFFINIKPSRDGAKLADYLKKLLQVYKDTEPEKHFETMKLFLAGSEYYDLIKDQPDLPPQIDIWKLIIEKLDKEQAQKIDNEVASRRFRISAGTPAQVRDEVEAEVFGVSKLGVMYENVLALVPEDDKEQKEYWKLKLLRFYSKRLMGVKDKTEVRKKKKGRKEKDSKWCILTHYFFRCIKKSGIWLKN